MRIRTAEAVTLDFGSRQVTMTPDTPMDLPTNEAVKALTQHPGLVRLDERVRVVPGCDVTWMTDQGTHGPGRVLAVWTHEGKTWLLATQQERTWAIPADCVMEVNPSPILDQAVNLAVDAYAARKAQAFAALVELLHGLVTPEQGAI